MARLTAKQLRELRESPIVGNGNRVGIAIDIAGLTQQEIARETGLLQPYVSDVARSRYQTITVDNARKFADLFGCAIEDLFPAREEAKAS